MIKVDLGMAFSVYFVMIVLCFIGLWFFSAARKNKEDRNITDLVRRCPYCGKVFLEDPGPGPVQCPLCESYLEGS